MKTRADSLKPGDLIDLEGDRYAEMVPTAATPATIGDMWGAQSSPDLAAHQSTVDGFKYEYAEVESTERETDNCIVVHTSMTSFGCPPAHEVERVATGKREATA